MLVPIEPKATVPDETLCLSPWLLPIIDAARSGQSLVPSLQNVIRSMGFGSFVYGVGTSKELHRDERFFFWTSVPHEWVAEYDSQSYIEVDPRVAHGWSLWPPPLIWDCRAASKNPSVAKFLDRAAKFGIGSGLAIYFREGGNKIMFALNRPERRLTSAIRSEIAGVTAQAMYLGTVLHSVFLAHVIERGVPPLQQGSPLSPRERQCLQLAAHGMTSIDIGEKLGIAERTANFHFSNIISKLGVLNRNEAIAKGVGHGLIQVDTSTTPIVPALSSKIREAQLKRWEALHKARAEAQNR
ncbi:MAG: autoinducer binding domain-containing protein [Casimicrobiaceae bacterium]